MPLAAHSPSSIQSCNGTASYLRPSFKVAKLYDLPQMRFAYVLCLFVGGQWLHSCFLETSLLCFSIY